jgi:isocitrate/isopropylmalate dehydrogenase
MLGRKYRQVLDEVGWSKLYTMASLFRHRFQHDRHDDALAINVAERIEAAVAKLLQDETVRTIDLGGQASTSDVTQELIRILESSKPL